MRLAPNVAKTNYAGKPITKFSDGFDRSTFRPSFEQCRCWNIIDYANAITSHGSKRKITRAHGFENDSENRIRRSRTYQLNRDACYGVTSIECVTPKAKGVTVVIVECIAFEFTFRAIDSIVVKDNLDSFNFSSGHAMVYWPL